MKKIDTARWQPREDNANKLEYAGQRTGEEVFKELEYRLKHTNFLPDKSFELSDEFKNGAAFPQNARIGCFANWGEDNKDVFLEIVLNYQDTKGKWITDSFATGKSKGNSPDDLDRMFLIASSCTKAFNCEGEYARYVTLPEEKEIAVNESVATSKTVQENQQTNEEPQKPKDKEENSVAEKTESTEQAQNSEKIEETAKQPNVQEAEETTVIHLNQRERQIVADSLLETSFRLRKEKKPFEEVENLLRRVVGNITDYIKSIGDRTKNVDYADMARLAIVDGNMRELAEALPHIPHMHGNLLTYTANRSDDMGRLMADRILSTATNLSSDIYKQACLAAISSKNADTLLLLVDKASKCVPHLSKDFFSDIIQQALPKRDYNLAQKIVDNLPEKVIGQTDPHLLKIAIMDKEFDLAKSLIIKGIDVKTESPMLYYAVAKQQNTEFANLLKEKGADPSSKNSLALQTCVETKDLIAAKFLVQHGASCEKVAPMLFYEVAKQKDLDFAYLIMDKGANPNGEKSLALTKCMETNDMASAMFLLKCGAKFEDFLSTISERLDKGDLSEEESSFVFAVESFWKKNIVSQSAENSFQDTVHDNEELEM